MATGLSRRDRFTPIAGAVSTAAGVVAAMVALSAKLPVRIAERRRAARRAAGERLSPVDRSPSAP